MFINKVRLVTIFAAVAMVSACGGGKSKSGDGQSAVKETHVRMAAAVYGDALSTAEELLAAVKVLLAEPTEDHLSAARAAYKNARVPYQQSEIMRWDTAITLEKSLDADGGPASVDDWEGQVNAWPLDENHIVSIIESDLDITAELLIAQNGVDDNEDNVSTGVHAVEFLLWGEDTHGIGPGAGERPAADFALSDCADAYCARRAEYLLAATELLVADLREMHAEWAGAARSTPGTLAYNFLRSDRAIDYMLGALREMAASELASARMSSGLTLGDPEETHDCFSDLTHLAIFYNFQGLKNVFYGRYGGVSGASLGDLVALKDSSIYLDIDRAFSAAESLMEDIYAAGERSEGSVHFDQIIGQGPEGLERHTAEEAVDALLDLDKELERAQTLLALEALPTDGSGD